MDFEQLEQLDAIERTGTMSAAAAELHISQPALSRSIQRLEAELGTPLFDRLGRQATINAAGRTALDYARQILRERQLMRLALDDIAQRERALMVGTVAPAPLWRLSALTVERFPEAIITSRTISPDKIEREVLSGGVDLAITNKPTQLPTIRCCQLMTESLSVVLDKSHPLAGAKTLSAAELDGESFLLSSGIGFWQDYCDTHYPHSHFVVQEDRVLFEHMLSNTKLAYFISDAPALANELPAHKVMVPLRDTAAHATFYLLVSQAARPEAQNIFEWVRSSVA